MGEEKKEKPILKINNEKEILTQEDLSEFIEKEYDLWRSQLITNQNPIREVSNAIYNAVYRAAFDALNNISSQWTNEYYPEEKINTFNAFSELQITPYSFTPIGNYCQKLFTTEHITAMYMLYLYALPRGDKNSSIHSDYYKFYESVNPTNQNTSFTNTYKGHEAYRLKANRLLLKLQILAGNDEIDSYLVSLEDAYNKTKKIVKNSEAEYKKYLDWKGEKEIEHAQWFSKFKDDILERGKQTLRRLVLIALKRVRLSRKTLEASRAAFESQVNFTETVQYWNTKEADHNRDKKYWLCGIIGFVILSITAPIGVTFIPDGNLNTTTENLMFGYFHPVKLLITTLIVSFGSFAIRFCSKQFSYHNHLALTALERQVMLKTYIGLMLNGNLNEHEDRKIALDSLFRHSPTGVIDEATPSTPADSIIKIIERQTGNSSRN